MSRRRKRSACGGKRVAILSLLLIVAAGQMRNLGGAWGHVARPRQVQGHRRCSEGKPASLLSSIRRLGAHAFEGETDDTETCRKLEPSGRISIDAPFAMFHAYTDSLVRSSMVCR